MTPAKEAVLLARKLQDKARGEILGRQPSHNFGGEPQVVAKGYCSYDFNIF